MAGAQYFWKSGHLKLLKLRGPDPKLTEVWVFPLISMSFGSDPESVARKVQNFTEKKRQSDNWANKDAKEKGKQKPNRLEDAANAQECQKRTKKLLTGFGCAC